jgi:hypothetical protein
VFVAQADYSSLHQRVDGGRMRSLGFKSSVRNFNGHDIDPPISSFNPEGTTNPDKKYPEVPNPPSVAMFG